ncbi:hypothetical protein DFH07DRAFT_823296 [Mycena maculata]|uniref:DUF6697 domain-containing protein n=1 Tax=Mycena maculata TaxID=230809 RepID=A0AAD7J009_9AGAR|nr:hypothetical protein DFH07DRAFT_823296 [Mycena maculata]
MDQKSSIGLDCNKDELQRLIMENERLRGIVDRVRQERDDAETRFANSQAKVAELEHQVRKHALKISDLEAEGHTSLEAPKPPVDPPSSSEIIEISDNEENEIPEHIEAVAEERDTRKSTPVRATLEPEQSSPARRTQSRTPKRERLVLDYVAVPATPSKPRGLVTGQSLHAEKKQDSSSRSPSFGRFKRARAASPSIETSSSSTVAGSRFTAWHSSDAPNPSLAVRSISPLAAPSAKRQKKSKGKDVKEVKEEALTLPQDTIDMYLSDIPNFNIDPPSLDALYVSREFLRLEFGGSDQQFIAYFKPTRASDRRRAAVFPQADLNPFLPDRPGVAGLIFASRDEITKDPPWALFCKDKPSGEAVWRYMGDYQNKFYPTAITAEQFKSQNPKVKQQWGKLLLKAKQCEVYVSLRARVALRKAGLPTAPDDVAREVFSVRKNQGIKLTPEDIIEALSRGDENIKIIQMQCVSYDREFVADMARRHDAWTAPGAVATRAREKQHHQPRATAEKWPRHAAPKPKCARDEAGSDSGSDFSVESEESDSDVRVRPRRCARSATAAAGTTSNPFSFTFTFHPRAGIGRDHVGFD